MNQYDNKKIQQKICMHQTDLKFNQSNCRHKQAKFDLILNKNVKLQEEVKNDTLESLVFNRNIEDTLTYHLVSSATVFFKFWRKNNLI